MWTRIHVVWEEKKMMRFWCGGWWKGCASSLFGYEINHHIFSVDAVIICSSNGWLLISSDLFQFSPFHSYNFWYRLSSHLVVQALEHHKAYRKSPRNRREKYLFALPHVSTGSGGARHKSGTVLKYLIPFLIDLARSKDVDIGMATYLPLWKFERIHPIVFRKEKKMNVSSIDFRNWLLTRHSLSLISLFILSLFTFLLFFKALVSVQQADFAAAQSIRSQLFR